MFFGKYRGKSKLAFLNTNVMYPTIIIQFYLTLLRNYRAVNKNLNWAIFYILLCFVTTSILFKLESFAFLHFVQLESFAFCQNLDISLLILQYRRQYFVQGIFTSKWCLPMNIGYQSLFTKKIWEHQNCEFLCKFIKYNISIL